MTVVITPFPCDQKVTLPVSSAPLPFAHKLDDGILPVGTGWELFSIENQDRPIFRITGQLSMPAFSDMNEFSICPALQSLVPVISQEPVQMVAKKNGYAVAVITLSDKAALGARTDTAGPACMDLIKNCIPVTYAARFILPDERPSLKSLLANLALVQQYDLICTCGGTGLGQRDITPQVTEALLDLKLPGFMQAMMNVSLSKTPRAIISRALAGVIGNCLVINLPGSKKAAEENLSPLLPGLDHALCKLKGDTCDCGV